VERWIDRLDHLELLLDRLREENREYAVLVEGRKDEYSLRCLGLTGEIIRFNRGKGIVATSEGLVGRERVILLFDWDRKGTELTRAFVEALKNDGIDYDTRIRSELAILVKKDIKDVESLARMLRRLRETTPSADGLV